MSLSKLEILGGIVVVLGFIAGFSTIAYAVYQVTDPTAPKLLNFMTASIAAGVAIFMEILGAILVLVGQLRRHAREDIEDFGSW